MLMLKSHGLELEESKLESKAKGAEKWKK